MSLLTQTVSRGMSSSAVVCGLPGDVQHADDVKDFRNAKVGGQPVLPGQCPPEALSTGHPMCRDCKKSMVLVAQVLQSWPCDSLYLEAS